MARIHVRKALALRTDCSHRKDNLKIPLRTSQYSSLHSNCNPINEHEIIIVSSRGVALDFWGRSMQR